MKAPINGLKVRAKRSQVHASRTKVHAKRGDEGVGMPL